MNRGLAAVMIASALTSGVMSYWSFDRGYAAGQREPGCYEDEVMAVQIDHNPAHGLTWACENTEQFIERSAR